jgi:hypothetical protein
MKKIILSTIFFASFFALFAQNSIPKSIKKPTVPIQLRKNYLSIEGAGQNGAGAGFSYQRLLWGNYKTFLSATVGVGIPISLQNNAKTTALPVATATPYFSQNLLFNFGNKGNYGEVGLGGTLGKMGINSSIYNLYPMFGYRFQPSAGRIFLHIYFMPIFGESRTPNDITAANTCFDCPIPDSRNAIRPWGGFGAGYTF